MSVGGLKPPLCSVLIVLWSSQNLFRVVSHRRSPVGVWCLVGLVYGVEQLASVALDPVGKLLGVRDLL